MAYDKKKVDEIGSFLESIKGEYIGQVIPRETLSLVENLTIGDLIIEFGCNVDEATQLLKNITIISRRNTRVGFRANEKSVAESRVVGRFRKVIKESDEGCSVSLTKSDDYHPIDNEAGGSTFEDVGAGEQTGMIKSNLFSMASKAQSLHDMISDTDSLPDWVQEKIAVADSMIDVVSDYLKYEYKRVH